MPEEPVLIRAITDDDTDAFRALRIESLRLHPTSFTADLNQAENQPIEQWRQQVRNSSGAGMNVVMLADAGNQGLAGMAGVFVIADRPKLAHVGTVWGVYVREPFRKQRVGQRLVDACADWARSKGLYMLKLSAVQAAGGGGAAERCYARCGFVTFGVEPAAVQWEGKFYDETLMALRLR